METGVARVRKRHGANHMEWEAGMKRVGQAAADEGKDMQFYAHCSPSHTGQEHRPGFQPILPSSPYQ